MRTSPPKLSRCVFALFGFLVSFLLLREASAHHVFGMEVSPAFELFHTLAEPLFFATSGASLAWFLHRSKDKSIDRRDTQSMSVPFFCLLVSSIFGIFLASAAVYEGEGFLFLLLDVISFVTLFVLLSRKFRLPFVSLK